MPEIKIEIVCANIESVITAQQGGADRIELCDNLAEGGTTPSQGMIEVARKKISIGLFILIRPRSGDFLYSADEFEIMKRDIEICKQLKADGVVFGLLNPDGTVDKIRTSELVDLAKPMSATFHRAFDMTNDPMKAMEDIIECGCERILTSGQKPTALEGAEQISRLIEKAGNRIVFLPGGGISTENVASLISKTNATEIHSSAKTFRDGNMIFKRDTVKMGNAGSGEYGVAIADPGIIRRLREIVSSL